MSEPKIAMRAVVGSLIGLVCLLGTPAAQAVTATVIYTSSSYQPLSGLVFDKSGNLWAALSDSRSNTKGKAQLVKLVPPKAAQSTWTSSVVAPLTQPYGFNLGLDQFGGFYSLASSNADASAASINRFAPPAIGKSAWSRYIPYVFSYNLGSISITPGPGGSFFGTAANDGFPNLICRTPGCGTIFELSPPKAGKTAWTKTVLYKFIAGGDGEHPLGPLIRDQAGNLFGVATYSVFKLSPPVAGKSQWSLSIVYEDFPFTGAPIISAISDGNGGFYATTIGSTCCGKILKLSPPAAGQTGWSKQTLYTLTQAPKDVLSGNTLMLSRSGSLYGTTYNNSTRSPSLFRLTPPKLPNGSWIYSTVFRWSPNGVIPRGSIIEDAKGSLYVGATNVTGVGGSIYKISP